jgi:hypothetical protein
MHWIRQAEPISGFKLLLTFGNGEKKAVDLEPHLDGPIFEPLKDPRYFKTVRVNEDLDTIVWDNGADFSPDFLYEIGRAVAQPASAS